MFIIGDLLLYVTTSLVFSITCLCILLQFRAKDKFSAGFLTILIPMVIQMGMTAVITYINRILPVTILKGELYSLVCLFTSFSSILLTSILLFTLSRYLIDLLPESAERKKIGNSIVNIIVLLFLLISLFCVFYVSRGDWITAMNLTLGYHFLFGSFFMASHGIASLFYIKKASSREEESLLKGISITFLPLFLTFPLDMIFFSNHSFKLAYLIFSLLVVYLYFFISRNYFRLYEAPNNGTGNAEKYLKEKELSQRELEIALLLIGGQTNIDIGEKLFISINTVKSHIKNIYKKLTVKNRIQLLYLIRESDKSVFSHTKSKK